MPFVAGFFFFFASPELDGANVVAVFFTNLFKSRSKLFVFVLFGAAVVVVVVVVVASSSSPSLKVARGFTRAQRFKDRDRFLPDDDGNTNDDDDDVVVFEKERDDDVDANIAVVLGSDGRDPLSSSGATTFIVLWCWCVRLLLVVRACVMCVLIISVLSSSLGFFDIFFLFGKVPNRFDIQKYRP